MLIGDTISKSPTGEGIVILHGHPSHAKVQPVAVQRQYRVLDPSLPRTSNRGLRLPFALRRSNIIRFRLAVD